MTNFKWKINRRCATHGTCHLPFTIYHCHFRGIADLAWTVCLQERVPVKAPSVIREAREERGVGTLVVNGEVIDTKGYLTFHKRRIAFTLEMLGKMWAKKIVEVGSHLWV